MEILPYAGGCQADCQGGAVTAHMPAASGGPQRPGMEPWEKIAPLGLCPASLGTLSDPGRDSPWGPQGALRRCWNKKSEFLVGFVLTVCGALHIHSLT